MADLGNLLVKIGLTGLPDFQNSMNGVSGVLTKAVRDADNSARGFDRMGSALKGLGSTLTAAVTLPIAGVGIAATKMAADFELGIRKVGSLVGGFTDGELKKMEQGTLDLAKSMGIDAVKATDALYQAISAGVPKENALDFIRVASVAAIAGLTDTNVAVDALTTIIAAYGLETKDAKAVSDAMFQAVNIGKFEFKDLAAAIGPAAQQANNLGISYTELLASTATLSLTSGGVAQAVTQIESAMRALLNPTKEMDAALLKIGFQSGEAAVKSLGFEGTLQKLRETSGTSATAFNALFGRIEGATGALGLTGDKAVKAAADYDTMRHATDGLGASTVAANEINKASSRQFDILLNNLKSTAIEMGLSLLPAVNTLLKLSQPLLQFLEGAVKSFASLPQPIQAMGIALAATAAAAGPLVFVAGQLLSSFATVTSTLKAVSAVLGLTAGEGLLGALGSAGLAGVLTAAGPLAIALGAAIAGWAIYKAVSEMQELNKQLNEFQAAVDRGIKASPQQAQQIELLVTALKRYNEEALLAGKQQIQIPAIDLSVANPLNAYVAALKAAAAEVPTVNATIKGLNVTLEDLNKSGGTLDLSKTIESFSGSERAAAALKSTLDKLKTTGSIDLSGSLGLTAAQQGLGGVSAAAQKVIETEKQLQAELKNAQKVYEELKKAGDGSTVSNLAIAAAFKKVQDAQAALTPKLKEGKVELTAHQQAVKVLTETLNKYEAELREVKKSHDAGIASTEAVARAEQKVKDVLEALTPVADRQVRSWEGLQVGLDGFSAVLTDTPPLLDNARRSLGDVTEELTKMATSLGDIKLPVYELGEAFKTLGVTSSEQLKITADKAKEAYERISTSSQSTEHDVTEAWKKMTAAQAEYLRSIGNEQGARELERALEAQVGIHQAAATKVTGVWTENVRQISTAFNDFAKKIVDDLLNGDLSITGALETLGKTMLRVFVEDGLSYTDKFIEKGLKAVLTNLGDILGKIPGIGDALDAIFKKVPSSIATPPFSTTSTIPGIGAPGGGTSGAAGASGFGSALGIFNAATGAISAITGVLSLFGIGQGGEKDRLNIIANSTSYLAWVFSAGGGHDALLNIQNTLINIFDAFTSWNRDWEVAVQDILADQVNHLRSIDAALRNGITIGTIVGSQASDVGSTDNQQQQSLDAQRQAILKILADQKAAYIQAIGRYSAELASMTATESEIALIKAKIAAAMEDLNNAGTEEQQAYYREVLSTLQDQLIASQRQLNDTQTAIEADLTALTALGAQVTETQVKLEAILAKITEASTPPATTPPDNDTSKLPSAPGGSRTDTEQERMKLQEAMAWYNLFGQVGNAPNDWSTILTAPTTPIINQPQPVAPPPPTEYNAQTVLRGDVYIDGSQLWGAQVRWGEDRGLVIPQS